MVGLMVYLGSAKKQPRARRPGSGETLQLNHSSGSGCASRPNRRSLLTNMPRPRFFKLPSEKRAFILQRAGDEFVAKGYHGASLNRLLEAAKLSKGSFYYYFDDRDDLFAAVLESEITFKQIPESLRRANESSSYFSELERWLGEAGEEIFGSPRALALTRELARLIGRSELPRAAFKMQEGIRKAVSEVLVLGQEVGAVRRDLPQDLLVSVTMKLGEGVDLWTKDHLDELSEQDPEARLNLLMGLFRRLVIPSR
jgi:AcrR family transcriptional regulator